MCGSMENDIPCVRTYDRVPNEITNDFVRVGYQKHYRGDTLFQFKDGKTTLTEYHKIERLIMAFLGERNPAHKIRNVAILFSECYEYVWSKLANHSIPTQTIRNRIHNLANKGYVNHYYDDWGSFQSSAVGLTSKGWDWLGARGL